MWESVRAVLDWCFQAKCWVWGDSRCLICWPWAGVPEDSAGPVCYQGVVGCHVHISRITLLFQAAMKCTLPCPSALPRHHHSICARCCKYWCCKGSSCVCMTWHIPLVSGVQSLEIMANGLHREDVLLMAKNRLFQFYHPDSRNELIPQQASSVSL